MATHQVLILRSGVFAASRRMVTTSWFETAQVPLLTVRTEMLPGLTLEKRPEPG
jgi:hypothetical protein